MATEHELAQMRRTSKERLEYATVATAAQREMQRLRVELAQAQEDVATHEREVRDMRGPDGTTADFGSSEYARA